MPGEIMTTPTAGVKVDPLLMYEPLTSRQKINPRKIPWTTEPELITPQQAQVILRRADEYHGFSQRPRTPAAEKRFLDLINSGRFVDYFPFGPLGFNEKDDVVMNGGNRLGAVAKSDRPVGFIVIRNCPTWLIDYIDNNKRRTVRETLKMKMKNIKPETQAVARLGMRYEEFIFGKRGETGWTDWSKQTDENVDYVNWLVKREYVTDIIPQAKAIGKATGLQVPALTCFIAYQQLAWPDDDKGMFQQFIDGLESGVMLYKGHPALTLREWASDDGFIGSYSRGRREGHLLLLFKFFTLFAEGQKVNEVRVARGLPMAMPYHPNGWETACKNVREQLVEMG